MAAASEALVADRVLVPDRRLRVHLHRLLLLLLHNLGLLLPAAQDVVA